MVLDKINQWGQDLREGYTRLGLLKPFLAENAAIYFFTGTATAEDIKVNVQKTNFGHYFLGGGGGD